jgi:hypothetical protein
VAGWTIYLDANATAALDPGEVFLVTGADGSYSFTGLPAGTYIVREVAQPGWAQTAPAAGFHAVVLAAGETASAIDFGNQRQGVTTDHFQCYKARDSKGSICRDGSSNEGGVCTSERDCGGVEDETALCVPRSFPKGLQVTLTDQFGAGRRFDVQKPVNLCNPADKNSEGIQEPAIHLTGYQIKLAKGQPPHGGRTEIRVLNQFHPDRGELRVDTVKPDRLLVPTATSQTGPVDPPVPGSHEVDHFTCYRARPSRGTAKFEPIHGVAVVDQFNQPRLVDVTEPTRLCTATQKNGEPIAHAANHLMCYRVKAVTRPPQPRHVKVSGIFANNQFGPARLDTVTEEEFCVPSVTILTPAP